MTRKLLTARDVADRLGVRIDTIWRLARQRRIPTVHVGRLVRFDRDAIDGWLAAGGCIAADRERASAGVA